MLTGFISCQSTLQNYSKSHYPTYYDQGDLTQTIQPIKTK